MKKIYTRPFAEVYSLQEETSVLVDSVLVQDGNLEINLTEYNYYE